MLKELVRTSVLTSASRIASLFAGLVAVAITSRVLGPAGRGEIAVVATLVGLAATLGHLSLGQIVLKLAADSTDIGWLPATLGNLVVATLVVWVLSGVVLLASHIAGVGGNVAGLPLTFVLLGFLTLPFTVWTTYATYLLLAVGRVRDNNRAQVVGAFVSLAAVAVLVVGIQGGVAGALVATLIGLVATTAVGGRALFAASNRRVAVSTSLARRLVRDGAKLHLTAIGAYLFSGLDILMVQHYRSAADAGLFQLAFQLYAPLLLIPQAVADALSSKLGVVGVRGLWPFQRKIMALTVVAMVMAGAMLALLAPLIVRVVAGPAFDGSVPIFRIYMIGLLAATVNGVMGVQWLGRGLFLQTSVLTFAAGAANFLFNLVFIPHFGAKGAAIATVVGVYALPFTANTILALRCEREARAVPLAPAAA